MSKNGKIRTCIIKITRIGITFFKFNFTLNNRRMFIDAKSDIFEELPKFKLNVFKLGQIGPNWAFACKNIVRYIFFLIYF